MGKVWEMRPVLNNMNRALDDLDKSKDTALQDMVTTHRKTAANWNAAINFCGNYIAAAKESKDRSKLHHDVSSAKRNVLNGLFGIRETTNSPWYRRYHRAVCFESFCGYDSHGSYVFNSIIRDFFMSSTYGHHVHLERPSKLGHLPRHGSGK
jgi:hypothetical protein